MSKSVRQSDLRRLMTKAKSTTSSTSASRLKKYKLSAREQQLLEQQKANEEEEKKARAAKRPAPLPQDFFEKKPAKSILKNSSTASSQPALFAQPAPVSKTKKITTAAVEAASSSTTSASGEDEEQQNLAETGSIPEGFFDDPVKDAKARKIEYKDPKDEEWAQFQKEISQELDTANEMVSEEQQEATVGRQLDEIDDQMRAWSKVACMEKKLTAVEATVQQKRNETVAKHEDSEDSSDDEGGDIFDWRLKKS